MRNFEEFYSEKVPIIRACLKALKINRNHDDFFQIGTIALFKAYNTYDQNKDKYNNFDLYAYYFILNTLKNELTRQTKDKEKIEHLKMTKSLEPESEELNIIERIAYEKALLKLPKDQQEILRLKEIGYKNYEIADALNIPLDTLKYKIKAAYKAIRELM